MPSHQSRREFLQLGAAAGAQPSRHDDCDGMNILPALTGHAAVDRDTLHWDCNFQWAVRQGKWKLKAITNQKAADDVGREEHTEVVERLTALHRRWREEIAP